MENCVKELRIRKGKSQKELAQELGISVFYLNKIENNKRNLNHRLAARIAKTLDVGIRNLFLH